MLDQSVVVDFNKNNSVGVALTGWVKPNEHDNIKGSLSDIENKIPYIGVVEHLHTSMFSIAGVLILSLPGIICILMTNVIAFIR